MATNEELSDAVDAGIVSGAAKAISGDEGSISFHSLADQIAWLRYRKRASGYTTAGVLRSIQGPTISPPSARGD